MFGKRRDHPPENFHVHAKKLLFIVIGGPLSIQGQAFIALRVGILEKVFPTPRLFSLRGGGGEREEAGERAGWGGKGQCGTAKYVPSGVFYFKCEAGVWSIKTIMSVSGRMLVSGQ